MIRKQDVKKTRVELLAMLEDASVKVNKLRKKMPEDLKLRAVKHRNGYQYFMRKNGETGNGTYIDNAHQELAANLAQIDYYDTLIKAINNAINALDLCSEHICDIYDKTLIAIPEAKRAIIKIPHLTDEMFLQAWLNQEYNGLEFAEEKRGYYTRQGIRVRSKSEMIIADILHEQNIPFLYEKPLALKGNTFFPDFTLMDLSNRKEIYWEHFGLMDDMEYRNNAFGKIRKYEANALYQQDSLIVTFETERYPLNVKDIREMVCNLKIRLGYA